MPKAIAVYGSLRYGGPANGLMKGFKYLGRDTVYGRLFNLGVYPALCLGDESKPDEQVVVDVYEITDERLLQGLDRYEGYFPDAPEQSLYTREMTLTVEGNLEVWVYDYRFLCNDNEQVVSGDYFDTYSGEK